MEEERSHRKKERKGKNKANVIKTNKNWNEWITEEMYQTEKSSEDVEADPEIVTNKR